MGKGKNQISLTGFITLVGSTVDCFCLLIPQILILNWYVQKGFLFSLTGSITYRVLQVQPNDDGQPQFVTSSQVRTLFRIAKSLADSASVLRVAVCYSTGNPYKH